MRTSASAIVLIVTLLGVNEATLNSAAADQSAVTDAAVKLRSSNDRERMQAVSQLIELGPVAGSATPALIEALKQDDLAFQNECVVALGRIGAAASAAVPSLRSILQGDSVILKHSALHALRMMGPAAQAAMPELKLISQSDDAFLSTPAAWAIVTLNADNPDLQKAQIPILVTALESPVEEICMDAVYALSELGAAAVPAIEAAIAKAQPRICWHACDALAGMGLDAEAAVPTLVSLVADRDSRVCWHAARALGDIGAQPDLVVPALVKALNHPEPAVRASAADSLGRFGSAAAPAVSGLQRMLSSEDVNLRLIAARTLGLIGPAARSAIPSLDKAVKDEEGAVTLNAVEALGRIGSAATPTLVRYLRDPALRPLILMVLSDMGPEAAGAAMELARLLEDEELQTRIEACIALAAIGEPAKFATPALMKLLNSQKEGRGAAAYALAKLGASDAISSLRKTVSADDEKLRMASAWALVTLEPQNDDFVELALPALATALEDPRPLVRQEVADLIGKLGVRARATAPALLGVLETEPNPEVRSAVLHALVLADPENPQLLGLATAALESADPNLQNTGGFVAAQLGTKARQLLPTLRLQLRSPTLFDRAVAAWAILKVDPTPADIKAALPILADASDHPESRVRTAIASVLKQHSGVDADADAALKRLQNDPAPEVKAAANGTN